MKKTIICRLGTFLLAAALCITVVPADLTFAADTPADVSRVFVHDPAILKANGTYYLFGSHLADATSTDLMNWTQMNLDWNWREGDSWKNDSVYGEVLENLAEPFAWAGYDDGDIANGGLGVWAPNAIYNPDYVWKNGSKGAYMLYYSTSSTWRRSCIGYAVSKTPAGPYQHVDTMIYSGFSQNGKPDPGLAGKNSKSDRNTKWDNDYLNLSELIEDEDCPLENVSNKWFDSSGNWNHNYAPNAIDPTVFFSKEGDMYMCYGSWSGGIFILELDKSTGAAKYPGEDGKDEGSGNFIDRYFGTHIAGGNHESGEGPYILYDSETGYYYLYETYGHLDSYGGYNMRLFRSKNVYGPYTDAAGRNAKDSNKNNDQYGIKLIGNYQFNNQPGYRAAGHNSALIDDDGKRYLFYHQRFDDNWGWGHQVRVRQQYLNEDDWPVNAVYEYRGEKIGHYNDKEIIGSYDLINHGTATNGNMIYSSSLALFADGTVGGAMEGTWEKSTGEGRDYDYITLNLDNAIYKGILYKQFNDESIPQKVMTFSVIGNNNTCLWGSRATASKSLADALVYGFNFETAASGNSISPVKHSKKNSKATLSGTASIVTNAKRGSKVLHVQNQENAFQANYLQLPADTFSAITKDGFTVSMWVNAGTATSAQSALFEANSGNKDVTEPMTRISAGLQPCINADENTDVISYPLNRNEWHHVAYSVDTKGIRLYLDGKIVRVLSGDLSNCFDSSLESCIQKATNVCLGSGMAFEAEDVQDVSFDDVAIYSASLSDEQIAEIYSKDTLKEAPIKKSAQTISVTSNYNKTYGDKAFSLKAKLTKGNGTLRYSSNNNNIAKVDAKTGKVTIKNTGIAKITITASETETYKKQTKTVTIKIAPKKTSLSTVKSKSAKKAVLTWKTVKNASGYRIQYATNSKFKSARTVTVSKSNTKTKTISKLTRKKTYYFRIQPYKKSGNTKIYGAYSKAKRVKIK